MIKPKSLKGGQWKKNEKNKLQQCPKATFDILIAKHKEGKADIRERENWTIQNGKLNNSISMSQAIMLATESSSNKRSITLPWQNSEGWDRHQWDYHPMPHFSVGPPMPGPWGPLLMV
jgi:hypothetical protein